MITGDQTPLGWATSVLRRAYRRKKVFGIGWHKTGTKTLGRCLEVLGYHHAGYDFSLLQDYFDGDVRRIFAIADRYTGFDDWPWPFVFRELERIELGQPVEVHSDFTPPTMMDWPK